MDQDILTDIILEKPASEWPAAWAAMRLPLETLPVRVSSMVQSRLDEALKAKKKKSWTFRLFERRIASGFVLSGFAAAAVILSIWFLLFRSRSPSIEKKELNAIVLFAAGSVRTESTDLKSGDLARGQDTILVGPGSVCDLQIAGAASSIIIRLHENTRFRMDSLVSDRRTSLNGKLDAGNALVHVSRISAGEDFRLVSPTSVASVRGTKFEMSVSQDGSTRTDVYEGSVSTRMRLAALEDLPNSVIESGLSGEVEALEKAEKILNAGESASIAQSDVDRHLAGNAELKAVLERPEIQRLTKGEGRPEEVRGAARAVENHFSDSTRRTNFEKSLKTVPPLETRTIDARTMQEKIKEYNELIGANVSVSTDEKTRREAVQTRNAAMTQELESRIESTFGRASETLLLRDGRRIKGVIFQEGSAYHVFTVEGQFEFPESEVEGFAF